MEHLENLQEEAVLRALTATVGREIASGRNLCRCDRCFTDMMALALNTLPPRYVADRYNRFPLSDTQAAQEQEQVQAAVQMAINRVNRRPHHP